MNMYTLKTVEKIVETFVKEDAPQWVKDYVRNFVKNYYFVEEETTVNKNDLKQKGGMQIGSLQVGYS